MYVLVGRLCCGLCGRLLDSHWVYRRPGYRCRHGHTSARSPRPDRPKNIYVRHRGPRDRGGREDAAITYAATQLGIPLADPEQIADQLRATHSTIICAPDGKALQRHIDEADSPPTQT